MPIQQGNYLDPAVDCAGQARHDAQPGALPARHADGAGRLRRRRAGTTTTTSRRAACRGPCRGHVSIYFDEQPGGARRQRRQERAVLHPSAPAARRRPNRARRRPLSRAAASAALPPLCARPVRPAPGACCADRLSSGGRARCDRRPRARIRAGTRRPNMPVAAAAPNRPLPRRARAAQPRSATAIVASSGKSSSHSQDSGRRIADHAAALGHALAPVSSRQALRTGDECAHQLSLRSPRTAARTAPTSARWRTRKRSVNSMRQPLLATGVKLPVALEHLKRSLDQLHLHAAARDRARLRVVNSVRSGPRRTVSRATI